MNTQDRSFRELITHLWELPVDSVASFKVLDQKLRDDSVLREELKFFLFLFFKEAISLYSFLSHIARKLMTKEVAEQFTRIDPPPGKLAFEIEVPTIYKMLEEVAEEYKEYYSTADNIANQIGLVLSNSKEWRPPGNRVSLLEILQQYFRVLSI
ncbi:uncharacterized protein [Parasteatoda tepidariorum]|uniref:uncharacterized protein n=1 Tax=Parasteatoda tepidariorum TaxID=114398 RepID=UPI0039BCD5DB